ncbi:MAG: DUF58 domain-containing protein [Actinobacteria bacterium]|nr:DUF58 domain-containing protein [Actinomycetota bacterium]
MAPPVAPPGARERSLRQLELAVTRKLDGLLHGDHQGLVPGTGSDPAGGRPYEPGDDVRRMDWNLTARAASPHVRNTVADRELETWVLVDRSASLDFGTSGCEKRDLAHAAIAAFGFLTVRDGNRLAMVEFGPDGTTVHPPRSGREVVLCALHRLEREPRAGPGSAPLAEGLRTLRLAARRRGLVVVVTDLLDASPWERELRALATRHEVVVVEVRDPREAELPEVGLVTLVDPESGRLLEVQTGSRRLRARFAEAAARRREQTARAVRATGAGHLVLSTDRDWMLDVVRYVASKRRRR